MRFCIRTVTLYKCSVNSGSCSRCLSPETSPASLGCVWCYTDCNVKESVVCQTNGYFSRSQSTACGPPIITNVRKSRTPFMFLFGTFKLEMIKVECDAVWCNDVLFHWTIGVRDQFRSRGGGGAEVSCPNIFHQRMPENQVVIYTWIFLDFFFCPKMAIWEILMQPPSSSSPTRTPMHGTQIKIMWIVISNSLHDVSSK